jgi:hypothetical protein
MTKPIKYLMGMALLLAAVSASAQATRPLLVNVPFPFLTAGKNWPAGDYGVQVWRDFGVLTLSSPGVTSATMLTIPDQRSGGKHAYLQFQCSGDEWVLREVVLDGTARILPASESEKEQGQLVPSCQKTIATGGGAMP